MEVRDDIIKQFKSTLNNWLYENLKQIDRSINKLILRNNQVMDKIDSNLDFTEKIEIIKLKEDKLKQIAEIGSEDILLNYENMVKIYNEIYDLISETDDNIYNQLNADYMGVLSGDLDIEDIIIETDTLYDCSIRFLNSTRDTVKKSSEPLTNQLYNIKDQVNKFILKVKEWKSDLEDEKSEKNFKSIMSKYNNQKNIFETFSNSINSSISKLEKNLKLVKSTVKQISANSNEINNIASNVKVLSLNASVEAARAGEHGRGFKIIANETKKLSDETQSLLKSILNSIDKTQKIIHETVEMTQMDLRSIVDQITAQQSNFSSLNSILVGYYKDFENIIKEVSIITVNISNHIDQINPFFQTHDIVLQEMNNLVNMLTDHQEKLNKSFDINKQGKEHLVEKFIEYVEEKVTTDNEVEVISQVADQYNIKLKNEIKRNNNKIELF